MKEFAVVFEIFVSELSTKLHRHFHDEDEADLQEALISVIPTTPLQTCLQAASCWISRAAMAC
jgi:hypothetical protein